MQKGQSKIDSNISLQNLEERFSALTGKPIGEYKGEKEEDYEGREKNLINLLNELPPAPNKAKKPKLEIELEELYLREQFEMAYADFPAIASNPPPLEELREMFSYTKISSSHPELRDEPDEVQQEYTAIFGESIGEEDQLPEEQPLLKEEKSPLQSSPMLSIPQEIKQQKQESSIKEDQKNLNEELLKACKNDKNTKAVLLVRKGANPNALCQSGESAISYAKTTGNNRLVAELKKEENKKNHLEIITSLTPITIREKDQDGNTRIHKLIKSKKITELKKFIEENTEILKATPIIDDFQSVPAICLRNDRGENPLHMMLLDLDTWRDELIIQIAKLHPGMIHVEDNFGIIPFDLTQPKSNLEKAFIELDPLANNFGKTRKIDIEENNQNNKKGKEPIQEIRRRKGPDEGKLITVNQSLPVFQPKQNSLPKYAAYGGLIGAGLGAGGVLIAIGIASGYALSWSFPPLGLALTIIGACTAIGLATGATYSKKDVIANKLATVFHKGTADNKTFIMEPDTHLKNA